jgi:MerR family redox-sensitive transcriptional activator SoxR
MMSIGEVAELSDVPASTLRYYEKVGLLPETKRNSGQRRYSPDILQRIRVIKMAQQVGFQVQEIFVLFKGFDSNVPPSERWRNMAEKKQRELEEKNRQITMMQQVLENGMKCACLTWDECYVSFKPIEDCCKGG